jgi:hypothetical protein
VQFVSIPTIATGELRATAAAMLQWVSLKSRATTLPVSSLHPVKNGEKGNPKNCSQHFKLRHHPPSGFVDTGPGINVRLPRAVAFAPLPEVSTFCYGRSVGVTMTWRRWTGLFAIFGVLLHAGLIARHVVMSALDRPAATAALNVSQPSSPLLKVGVADAQAVCGQLGPTDPMGRARRVHRRSAGRVGRRVRCAAALPRPLRLRRVLLRLRYPPLQSRPPLWRWTKAPVGRASMFGRPAGGRRCSQSR